MPSRLLKFLYTDRDETDTFSWEELRDALLLLDESSVPRQDDPPDDPEDGDLWSDTSANAVKQYFSGTWHVLALGGDTGLDDHRTASPIDHPDASITSAKFAAGAVDTAALGALAVTAAKIAADAVTTAKILDGQVTDAKLGNRSIDTTGATAQTDTLSALLLLLAQKLEDVMGEAWTGTPNTTIAAAAADMATAVNVHGLTGTLETQSGAQTRVDTHAAAQGAHGLYSGAGSPETVVTAAVGSLYRDTTNGLLYIKRSGAGNTGWIVESSMQAFARVRKSGAHATSNGTNYISWTTELDDTDNIWAIGAPTRFVVPAGMGGRWRGRLSLSNMETPQSVVFRKNGSTDVFRRAARDILTDSVDSFGSGTYTGLAQYETTMKLAAGDYIEAGSVDTGVRSWDVEEWLPMFEFEYLGPTN